MAKILFDKLLIQLVSFGAGVKMLVFVMVGFVYFYYLFVSLAIKETCHSLWERKGGGNKIKISLRYKNRNVMAFVFLSVDLVMV